MSSTPAIRVQIQRMPDSVLNSLISAFKQLYKTMSVTLIEIYLDYTSK